MEGQKLTVIKKKGKGGGAGHHGGSWKVAFADFMTAMMAFFLLMWLLSMGPQKKQEELGHYFKNATFNLFGTSGGSSSSAVSMSDTPPSGHPQASDETETPDDNDAEETETEAEMKAMKAKLEEQIQERLADVKDQIVIGQFEGGIKIDIMDKTGQPMFQLGGTELTADAKKVLMVVAETIKDTTHRLEIEGHTDALGYSNNQQFGNWELSTARASAARVELEKSGINTALLARVSGYAATEPIIKEDPFDPRNRRISLRLLYPQPKTEPQKEASAAQPSIAPNLPNEIAPVVAPHPQQ